MKMPSNYLATCSSLKEQTQIHILWLPALPSSVVSLSPSNIQIHENHEKEKVTRFAFS
jgi:hypothetical protein